MTALLTTYTAIAALLMVVQTVKNARSIRRDGRSRWWFLASVPLCALGSAAWPLTFAAILVLGVAAVLKGHSVAEVATLAWRGE